ncbi:hypothetical protein [Prauserella halophila]|uniref:hypothetical protein n=1 Tax=Prauserella halophila TaxID=185641 RepID=UPI003558009B
METALSGGRCTGSRRSTPTWPFAYVLSFAPGLTDAASDRRPEARGLLDHLATFVPADGGWAADFDSYSPAAALEWRGYTTVETCRVLRRNGRL